MLSLLSLEWRTTALRFTDKCNSWHYCLSSRLTVTSLSLCLGKRIAHYYLTSVRTFRHKKCRLVLVSASPAVPFLTTFNRRFLCALAFTFLALVKRASSICPQLVQIELFTLATICINVPTIYYKLTVYLGLNSIKCLHDFEAKYSRF
jgi:hypothetical protein